MTHRRHGGRRRAVQSHVSIRWLFLVWCLGWYGLPLPAQEIVFNHLTPQDGLPTRTVYDLAQDVDGAVLLATNAGLARFDGRVFTVLPTATGGSPGCTDIQVTPGGDLFVLGFDGTVYQRTDRVLRPVIDVSPHVTGYADIALGDTVLWIATDRSFLGYHIGRGQIIDSIEHGHAPGHTPQILRIHSDTLVAAGRRSIVAHVRHTEGRDTMLSEPGQFRSFDLDGRTVYWNVWKNGPDRLHVRTADGLRQMDGPVADTLAMTNGTAFAEGLGRVWFGTTGGLVHTDDMHHIERSLDGLLISDVLIDREGQLWVSTTTDGVFVSPDVRLRIHTAANSPLRTDEVTALGRLGDILLAGSRDGWVSGIHGDTAWHARLDDSDGEVEDLLTCDDRVLAARNDLFVVQDGQVEDTLGRVGAFRHVALADDGTLYYGSHRSVRVARVGDAVADADIVERQPIRICTEEPGTLWVSELLAERCLDLSLRGDDLWVVTDEGLSILPGGDPARRRRVMDDPVRDVLHTPEETWLATSSGLVVMKDMQVAHRMDEPDGLPDDDVRSLHLAGGWVMAFTRAGIAVIDPSTRTVRAVFDRRDGLPTNEATDLVVIDSSLFISTLDGIVEIPLGHAPRNAVAPGLEIASIERGDDSSAVARGDRLPFAASPIHIRFDMVSLRAGDQAVISYRLGPDQPFDRLPPGRTDLTLLRLSEGSYALEAFATNEDGVRSPVRTFGFTVRPPFRRSPAFFILLVVAAVLLTALILMLRFNVLRKRLVLQEQIKGSELKAIKSQMNPHFIFNLINTIQHMVLTGDDRAAYDAINRFSRLVRSTLDHSEERSVTVADEVDLLRNYLELESLRFRDALDVDLRVECPPTVRIPPMLIQPFIENALVHGLLHTTHDRRLRVHIDLEDVVVCTVEDNGIGRARAKAIRQRQRGGHRSFSTAAIEKRFDLLRADLDERIGYTYQDLGPDEEMTTRVVIRIPVVGRGKETASPANPVSE